ncbi:MAG: tetratricopeptide repeat protein [Planctomycetes bacterium]|nr:tetratricopeptide repeat protein [Planctomycetota bacterium]
MSRRRGRWCPRAVALFAAFAAIAGWYWLDGALVRARRFAADNRIAAAKTHVGWYRRLHPRDPHAILYLAQLWISDESTSSPEAVETALGLLALIRDGSPLSAEARTQEGRIHLFLKRQPGRAERKFRAAIDVDKNLVEPRYLLWKLYDLTGRSHLAEPLVWSVVELCPESQRAMRLREWYMSQFFPATANPDLDQLLEVVDPVRPSPTVTEQRRFAMFRDHEPDRPIGHAALARWFSMEGQPKYALEMLDFGEPELADSERNDPYLLATYISALIDLGRHEEAMACLRRWPEPRDGYEYWRWKGVLDEDLREDYSAAIEAYDRALDGWPGPADWRTMVRKANCLTRLGRSDEAARLRAKADRVEHMMKDAVHQRLRDALAQLNDGPSLLSVAEYYRDLGRPREAAEWLQLATRLSAAP